MAIVVNDAVFVYDSNLSRNTNYALWYTMLCTERDHNNEPSVSISEAQQIFDGMFPIFE
jgi:hypothetical protein